MYELVSVIMGSKTDLPVMEHAAKTLQELGIPYALKCISAHRAPRLLAEYVSGLDIQGIEVIIAGAGGAAHLPGMAAAYTHLPVLGVPIASSPLNGLDAMFAIAQMPGGVPVATFAIGKAGAINAAVFAASILAKRYPEIRQALLNFRDSQTQRVVAEHDILQSMA